MNHNEKPIFEPHYMAFPKPSAKFMKLRHPIESLVPIGTYSRKIRFYPYESEKRREEVTERSEKDIERIIYGEIHEDLPKKYPDITRNEVVLSTVVFEEGGIETEHGVSYDRWIIGTVIVYQKVAVLTAMVEEY